MKFRLILDKNEPEITVVTEDGGITCIRQAEDIGPNPEDNRVAVSEHYVTRLTNVEGINSDNMFELLAEQSKVYISDWRDKSYNDMHVIQQALAWLCPNAANFELVNDLFTDLFPLVTTE